MTVSALTYNLFQAPRVYFSSESDPNSILSADKSSSFESNYASAFSMHIFWRSTQLPVSQLTQLTWN